MTGFSPVMVKDVVADVPLPGVPAKVALSDHSMWYLSMVEVPGSAGAVHDRIISLGRLFVKESVGAPGARSSSVLVTVALLGAPMA